MTQPIQVPDDRSSEAETPDRPSPEAYDRTSASVRRFHQRLEEMGLLVPYDPKLETPEPEEPFRPVPYTGKPPSQILIEEREPR